MVLTIDSFTGNHEFLSNFYPCDIYYEEEWYPTVEHAYQAMKTIDTEYRQMLLFECKTAAQAKKFGRHKLPLREDWEEIKLQVMNDLIFEKFAHNYELRQKLLNTRDAELIEGNWWGDTFWGVCNGIGQNHLGKILMTVREELRNE